jgi:hypothetical protein
MPGYNKPQTSLDAKKASELEYQAAQRHLSILSTKLEDLITVASADISLDQPRMHKKLLADADVLKAILAKFPDKFKFLVADDAETDEVISAYASAHKELLSFVQHLGKVNPDDPELKKLHDALNFSVDRGNKFAFTKSGMSFLALTAPLIGFVVYRIQKSDEYRDYMQSRGYTAPYHVRRNTAQAAFVNELNRKWEDARAYVNLTLPIVILTIVFAIISLLCSFLFNRRKENNPEVLFKISHDFNKFYATFDEFYKHVIDAQQTPAAKLLTLEDDVKALSAAASGLAELTAAESNTKPKGLKI